MKSARRPALPKCQPAHCRLRAITNVTEAIHALSKKPPDVAAARKALRKTLRQLRWGE